MFRRRRVRWAWRRSHRTRKSPLADKAGGCHPVISAVQLLTNAAIAHRRLAVGRRAVVVMPVGQCPQPWRSDAAAAAFMIRTDDGSPTVSGRPRPFVRFADFGWI